MNSDQLEGQLPADPLLETGAFIDPDANGNGHADDEPIAATPVSTSASAVTSDATPTPKRNKNKRTIEDATAAGRPDWLPENWVIDHRVRNSGATAGTVDKYYREPVSGKRFRSKVEVLHYLETGSKSKPKKNPAADGDNTATGSASAPKRKNSAAKTKEPAGFMFNFGDPPEMVTWTLENADEDRWSASIDGEKLTDSTQTEWTAVFDHLSNNKL